MVTIVPIQLWDPGGYDLPCGTINCQRVQQKMEGQSYNRLKLDRRCIIIVRDGKSLTIDYHMQVE